MGQDTSYETGQTCGCGGCGDQPTGDTATPSTVSCPDCGQARRLCGDCTARREYRIGYARYREGRRRLTAGLDDYAAERWTDARAHIEAAASEFQTAVDHFTTAVGRVESDTVAQPCEQARQKVTCLWQAMEWLSGATFARERSADMLAEQFRHDGRQRLQTAADYGTVATPGSLG